MADLTIGTVTLLDNAGMQPTIVEVGEAVSAFQPLYLDTSGDTPVYSLAKASDTDKDEVEGICYSDSASGGTGMLLPQGTRVDLGAILTKGTTYCLSTNAGKIAPQSDLTTDDAVVPLFWAETNSIAYIYIVNPATTIILD